MKCHHSWGLHPNVNKNNKTFFCIEVQYKKKCAKVKDQTVKYENDLIVEVL